MANQFVSLPAPAANGSGAPVDVSTFGGVKTVTNSGNGFTLEPSVTIEFSNELVPTRFAPLWTFGKPGERNVVVAARWMRATVSNYRGGGAPVVDVGGNDFNTSFATLVAPAGSGTGAAVDVSALPNFKTIHVAGPFRGALNVEISEDGGANYSQIATFYAPGYKSLVSVAEFMRVTRNGVPVNSPGLPAINIGATVGGGGDSAGIEVEDEGVALPGGPFSTFNFQGAGVVATDAGGGTADIVIPGITFEDEGVPLAGAPHDTVNFVGAITAADAGGGVVTVTVTPTVDTKQVFRYVVTGLEPDPSLVTIALPAARASANYNVQVTMGGPAANALKDTRALVASFTINDFNVESGAPLEAGDILMFTVEDLT